MIFNPLAARSVLSKKKELGSFVIDFGASTTTLAVYEDSKILHVRSLPVGSSYVTNDIAIGLKFPSRWRKSSKLLSVARWRKISIGGDDKTLGGGWEEWR